MAKAEHKYLILITPCSSMGLYSTKVAFSHHSNKFMLKYGSKLAWVSMTAVLLITPCLSMESGRAKSTKMSLAMTKIKQ